MQKTRNTPNRINGFASPVGNLLGKGVSNNNISTNSENVNENSLANNFNAEFSVPDEEEIGIEALAHTINKKWKYS